MESSDAQGRDSRFSRNPAFLYQISSNQKFCNAENIYFQILSDFDLDAGHCALLTIVQVNDDKIVYYMQHAIETTAIRCV